jgi:folate-binding protein YgfZ
MSQHSTTQSAASARWIEGYEAARHGVGLVSRDNRGWLLLSGQDRRSYLHGLLTNDIEALAPGRGCYAAYLTPQGRMIADLWVYELGDVVLLSTIADVADTVRARLDQFIFSEDVQVVDATATSKSVVLVGPDAGGCVARVLEGGDQAAALPEHGSARLSFRGEPAVVLRVSDLGVDGYEIVVAPDTLDALRAASADAGAVAVDPEAAEALRIEGGVPLFHRDMDEETIPLEAGIEARAISMTKGCYVGQEVIVRVLHRGHGRVARRLVGLVIESADGPAAGTAVTVDAREVGRVTSAAFSPAKRTAVAALPLVT